MEIGIASLADPDIRVLIAQHQRAMLAASPPGTSFALDLSGLDRPEVTVFAAREGETLLGIGALMMLSPDEGEIKSMRTADSALRRGVAQALLDHIVGEARRRGLARLLLETGTGETFVAANALYQRNSFTRRGPFGDYGPSDFNLFYERAL